MFVQALGHYYQMTPDVETEEGRGWGFRSHLPLGLGYTGKTVSWACGLWTFCPPTIPGTLCRFLQLILKVMNKASPRNEVWSLGSSPGHLMIHICNPFAIYSLLTLFKVFVFFFKGVLWSWFLLFFFEIYPIFFFFNLSSLFSSSTFPLPPTFLPLFLLIPLVMRTMPLFTWNLHFK